MELFYCRYEEGYSQRRLGESRAAGETIRQNMANRLDETIREEKEVGEKDKDMTKRGGKKERTKERRQKIGCTADIV